MIIYYKAVVWIFRIIKNTFFHQFVSAELNEPNLAMKQNHMLLPTGNHDLMIILSPISIKSMNLYSD